MIETLEQAKTRIRAESPYPQQMTTSGGQRAMTQDEYDAWVDDTARLQVAMQTYGEAEATERTERDKVRVALVQIAALRQKLAVTDALRVAVRDGAAWGSATAAQRQDILRVASDEALQDTAGAIRVLIGLGLIERER